MDTTECSTNSADEYHFFTPIEEAVPEILRRRQDANLLKKVNDYLDGDIPPYFQGENPVLYLARHVATPNLETLRFIEIAMPYNLPIVIGQDTSDKFVSNNSLKRPLGKMPILKGTARNGDEITECFTIVDFDTAQGKSLCDVYTKFGDKLTDFHDYLFKIIYPNEVLIVNESEWIDRNNRGDLLEHYKRMLALLIVHGVMFEWYPPDETTLVAEVLEPAFEFITKEFGYRPLIHNLIPSHLALEKSWESYPSILHPFVKKMYENKLNLNELSSTEELEVTKNFSNEIVHSKK